jgi:hypothetical protein
MNHSSSHTTSHDIPLPTDEKIVTLAELLYTHMQNEKRSNQYATVKQVLTILGTGAFIGASILAPGIVIAAKPFIDAKREDDYASWKQFNGYYLKRTLKRLHKEKYIEVKEQDNQSIVVLTTNGKRRILKYSLDTLSIDKPKKWDGRWRMILYDVSQNRRRLRDLFRDMLKQLGFYQLQESVWLYPYPCEEHVSFLREYYGVGNEVIYVIAQTLEDDVPYRTYFHV